MGADPIYDSKINDTTLPLTGELRLKGEHFKYEVYLLPIIGADNNKIAAVEEDLIKRMGNRMQNGKHCLYIDESIVRENIENDEYSVVAFIHNKNHDDVASGTLQYFDWCESGNEQLWMSDLCRISTSKQSVSPIKALIKVFENLSKKYTSHLKYLHLMVDNEDQVGAPVLIKIYEKYGFDIVSKSKCTMDDPDDEYTLMRKKIKRVSRTTRNLKSHGGRKTRRRK